MKTDLFRFSDRLIKSKPMPMKTPVLATLGLFCIFPAAPFAQEVLPTPPPAFKGSIGLSVKDSKSDFPAMVQAPKDAPNVVVILLDDVGYGAASTFGGPCNTPVLDRLAKNGLRYTSVHTTALCSLHRRTGSSFGITPQSKPPLTTVTRRYFQCHGPNAKLSAVRCNPATTAQMKENPFSLICRRHGLRHALKKRPRRSSPRWPANGDPPA